MTHVCLYLIASRLPARAPKCSVFQFDSCTHSFSHSSNALPSVVYTLVSFDCQLNTAFLGGAGGGGGPSVEESSMSDCPEWMAVGILLTCNWCRLAHYHTMSGATSVGDTELYEEAAWVYAHLWARSSNIFHGPGCTSSAVGWVPWSEIMLCGITSKPTFKFLLWLPSVMKSRILNGN